MEVTNFKVRYNVMDLRSIRAFAGIKGGMNGSCKDVYFVRGLGVSPAYETEIEEMDRQMSERQRQNQGRYVRLNRLPVLVEPKDIAEYSERFNRWKDSGEQTLDLAACAGSGILQEAAGSALGQIAKEYRRYYPTASESMEKNFIIKLMFWTEQAAGEMLRSWNGHRADKLVYGGAVKNQEYLFGYFLTLLGIDVLFLLPQGEPKAAPELLALSECMEIGSPGDVKIPDYVPGRWMTEKTERNQNVRNQSTQNQSTQNQNADQVRSGKAKAVNVRRPDRDRRTAALADSRAPAGQGASRQDGCAPAGQGTSCASGQGRHTAAAPASPPERSFVQSSDSSPGRVPVSTRRPAEEKRELGFEELALLASSVVMIAVHGKNGDVEATGSGIMISSGGYILTNNHVISGGRYFSIRIEGEDQAYPTDEIIKYHPLLDLAILRIDRRLKPLPIYRGTKPLVRGQKVVAIGSPLGLFNSVSDGIISGFRSINDVNMIQFTAPISHGSSGGAVLNMQGEIIGISTAGIDSGQNLNLAVDYTYIRDFVKGFTNQ